MKSNSKSSCVGFCGLLTIAFIVLKLCGVIKWAWIWVISPVWISIVLWVIIAVIMVNIKRKKNAKREYKEIGKSSHIKIYDYKYYGNDNE